MTPEEKQILTFDLGDLVEYQWANQVMWFLILSPATQAYTTWCEHWCFSLTEREVRKVSFQSYDSLRIKVHKGKDSG